MTSVRGATKSSPDEDDDAYWNESAVSEQIHSFKQFDESQHGKLTIASGNSLLGGNAQQASNVISLSKSLRNSGHFSNTEDDRCETITWQTSLSEDAGPRMSSARSARYRPGSDPPQPKSNESETKKPVYSTQIQNLQMLRSENRGRSFTEMAKEEAEIDSVKRKLRTEQVEKYQNPPIDETIRRIIKGHPYYLEGYRSLGDKIALLDTAVHYNDGDAILVIVIFLRHTLSRRLFHEKLLLNSTTVNQYIAHLKTFDEHIELLEIYNMLGRYEDAFMMEYRRALAKQTAEERILKLQECKQKYRTLELVGCLDEQIMLLERQRRIEADDLSLINDRRHDLFQRFPRQASVLLQPAITTLYYCLFYHYDDPDSAPSSPVSLCKQHKLTDKQYAWAAIRARAKLKRWGQIENLFHVRSIIGSKHRAPMGFVKVVNQLHRENAPPDILAKFTGFIDNETERLNTAVKLKLHPMVIEMLIKMKDRERLVAYAGQVPDGPLKNQISTALSKSSTKWKN